MTNLYASTSFDVTGQVSFLPGELRIAAWVFASPSPPVGISPTVLVCLPGASYTRAYYHLEVPGYSPETYSFALHMVKQGCVVVAIDHLGTGESARPVNGQELSLEVVARANAAVVDQVRVRLAQGTLIAGWPPQTNAFFVGVGHSMGAFLLITQQAHHRSFAAIAPLGNTNQKPANTPEELSNREDSPDDVFEMSPEHSRLMEQGYAQAPRSIMRKLFYAADVPADVIEADDALTTHVPMGIMALLGDHEHLSEHMATHAANIDVPVFLGNGDVDLSPNFRAEVATYPLARDTTLFQLAGSAHCHNFATTRTILWDRLAHWVQAIYPRA